MISTLLALLIATPPPQAAERAVVRAPTAVVEMRTAALIMSGQQGGALPIAVAVLPAAGAITTLVDVDGTALLEAAETAGGRLAVEVFAYVLGTELDVVAQTSLSLDVETARHRQRLAATGLKVLLPLEVPPGKHQLRVLAQAGETFGLRGLELPAGDAGGDRPRISTPVFHQPSSPWLVAVPEGLEAALPAPFGLDAGAPLPATRPATRAGGTILAQVSLGGDSEGGLVALVRRQGGEAVEAVEAALAFRDRTAAAGGESVGVSFTAPADLEPGLYDLAVAAGSGDGGQARSGFAAFFVEAEPSPATAGDEREIEPAAGRKRATSGRAHRQLARDAGAAYLRALRQLAAGDRQAAHATLRASEERVARALDAGAVELLAQTQARVLEPLADADWGCALPLILFHLDSSRAYSAGGRRILAHHATEMTLALADAYARKLDTPRAAAEAARAISSLGGHLQSSGSLSRAERLFTLALELDRGDPAALLGLATIFEKRGWAEKAVPLLADFALARPEHAEGALRLALNRARAGESAAALEILDRLARREPGWTGLLAHQELARLRLDDGDLPAAAGVLRRGLERWPGHPTLTLQLAWVLDAQGELRASSALLESVTPGPDAQPADERSRYNRWPRDVLAASRRQLAETAGDRLDELQRWLSSPGPGGGG